MDDVLTLIVEILDDILNHRIGVDSKIARLRAFADVMHADIDQPHNETSGAQAPGIDSPVG